MRATCIGRASRDTRAFRARLPIDILLSGNAIPPFNKSNLVSFSSISVTRCSFISGPRGYWRQTDRNKQRKPVNAGAGHAGITGRLTVRSHYYCFLNSARARFIPGPSSLSVLRICRRRATFANKPARPAVISRSEFKFSTRRCALARSLVFRRPASLPPLPSFLPTPVGIFEYPAIDYVVPELVRLRPSGTNNRSAIEREVKNNEKKKNKNREKQNDRLTYGDARCISNYARHNKRR